MEYQPCTANALAPFHRLNPRPACALPRTKGGQGTLRQLGNGATKLQKNDNLFEHTWHILGWRKVEVQISSPRAAGHELRILPNPPLLSQWYRSDTQTYEIICWYMEMNTSIHLPYKLHQQKNISGLFLAEFQGCHLMRISRVYHRPRIREPQRRRISVDRAPLGVARVCRPRELLYRPPGAGPGILGFGEIQDQSKSSEPKKNGDLEWHRSHTQKWKSVARETLCYEFEELIGPVNLKKNAPQGWTRAPRRRQRRRSHLCSMAPSEVKKRPEVAIQHSSQRQAIGTMGHGSNSFSASNHS